MLIRVGNFLQSSPDASIDLICLGPLSNIAEWCRDLTDLVESKVASVWILGGAHPNAGRTDEFNFGQDAAAASCVMSSAALRSKIRLVPGDVTSHNVAPESFIQNILNAIEISNDETARTTTTTTVDASSNLLSQVIREEQLFSIFYDPVCTFLYRNPQAARFVSVALEVCPETGVTKFTRQDRDTIPLAERVDFDAYQTWLLQAIQQS